ncbi:MAG: trimethylamine methyltransferase family protein [Phycisphaerales bacterium]|nr:MAG: trimethylamine methyltransferase family protein [Phycisphaerales bacterium]
MRLAKHSQRQKPSKGLCSLLRVELLVWLYLDNEVADYVKRIARGFEVDAEKVAAEIVQKVGPGGNYLAEEHTVRNFRQELWLPGPAWTRQSWDGRADSGRLSMAERITEEVRQILRAHKPEPLETELAKQVDAIVENAKRELG